MSPQISDANVALGLAIAKLVEVVDEENSALLRQDIISHAGYTDRKNHALRELMAAQRRDSSRASVDQIRPQLLLLSQALHANAKLLKHHIAAVGDVSDIIVGSLRDASSDGTYTRDSGLHRWR
jgi:hypothetical protein